MEQKQTNKFCFANNKKPDFNDVGRRRDSRLKHNKAYL